MGEQQLAYVFWHWRQAEVAPVTVDHAGALWMRQMVLGPGLEFCLHAPARVELPRKISARHVGLEAVWPE